MHLVFLTTDADIAARARRAVERCAVGPVTVSVAPTLGAAVRSSTTAEPPSLVVAVTSPDDLHAAVASLEAGAADATRVLILPTRGHHHIGRLADGPVIDAPASVLAVDAVSRALPLVISLSATLLDDDAVHARSASDSAALTDEIMRSDHDAVTVTRLQGDVEALTRRAERLQVALEHALDTCSDLQREARRRDALVARLTVERDQHRGAEATLATERGATHDRLVMLQEESVRARAALTVAATAAGEAAERLTRFAAARPEVYADLAPSLDAVRQFLATTTSPRS